MDCTCMSVKQIHHMCMLGANAYQKATKIVLYTIGNKLLSELLEKF